jgi:hypothetical protein
MQPRISFVEHHLFFPFLPSKKLPIQTRLRFKVTRPASWLLMSSLACVAHRYSPTLLAHPRRPTSPSIPSPTPLPRRRLPKIIAMYSLPFSPSPLKPHRRGLGMLTDIQPYKLVSSSPPGTSPPPPAATPGVSIPTAQPEASQPNRPRRTPPAPTKPRTRRISLPTKNIYVPW